MSGVRLGPYEIVGPLGSGGMGEVYRARDPRLGRDVAIKVLPAAFSADPERLNRFEQEARAAAALNHPNILAVYDIGYERPLGAASTEESSPYIVSELLDGETLRERLTGGGLPVRKAVECAVQIAHGLAAAHEKGITHRDLKPENIFVTHDGRVKILDFGLAKLTQAEPLAGASSLPTTPPNTLPGLVLGTVGYMSPEQVRGLQADYRSDIFAFGALLYEMLSGQRAFRGETTMDAMTAILKEDPPDLPTAERNIAPALARVVDRCLEKNPAARFQSTRDLAFALEALSTHSGGVPVAAMLPRPRRREQAAWAAAILFLLALLAALPFAVAHLREMPAQADAIRFSVPPPQDAAFPVGFVPVQAVSVSPDGRWLVFRAQRTAGPVLLWVRSLDSLDAQALPGTDGGNFPFWSPDSRFIAFFAQGKLKKIAVSGGPVQTLCDAPAGEGGTWNRDGVVVFAATGSAALSRVSAAGGQPTAATTLDAARKETSHRGPHFLPDGRHFLFLGQPGNTIQIASLYDRETRSLLTADSKVLYAPPGYLLFTRGGTLMAQPFEASRAELTGEPLPIAEQVVADPNNGRATFSVSQSGVLVYSVGTTNESQLVWLTRDGKPIGNFASRGAFHTFWLASDEKRAVVEQSYLGQAGQEADLWLLDGERGTASRFTFDPAVEAHPVWSPDGSRIVFVSGPTQDSALVVKAATGIQEAEPLVRQTPNYKQPTDWSLDGRIVVFHEQNRDTGSDVSVVPLDGDRKPRPVIRTRFDERLGQLSPDAHFLAYVSNETGREEVYVVSFPDVSGKWQISTSGGTKPRWRRDAKELFFVDAAGMLMSVPIALGRGVEAGVPKSLFKLGATQTDGWNYAVSADGQRILAMRPTEAAPTPITVVLNWTALLKK